MGISLSTLASRLDGLEWSVERALTTPVEKHRIPTRLAESDVIVIRRMFRDHPWLKQKMVADLFRVTNSTISEIKNGKKWKYVIPPEDKAKVKPEAEIKRAA